MENKNHPTFGNGKICYIEIPSIDIKQSAAFYRNVFSWNIREDNVGNVSFDDTVGEVSGMWVLDRKPATEIGFLISIMVSSIPVTLDLITTNGGKVLPVDTDPSEKTARFSDPTGNIFCLYQSSRSHS